MGTIDKIIKEIKGFDNKTQSFRKNKKREKLFTELREEILKLKEFENFNEQISFECKKYNIGLYTMYMGYLWGALSYICFGELEDEVI